MTIQITSDGAPEPGPGGDYRRGVLVVAESDRGAHITQGEGDRRWIRDLDDDQALFVAASLVAVVEARRARREGRAA